MKKITLAVVAASAAVSMPPLAHAGVFRTITVDGSVADWAGIAPAFTDATGDGAPNTATGSTQTVDFTSVYVANDANFLYFRFQLAQTANPTTYVSNYFINSDGNGTTGFGTIGSEIVIQGASTYQEAGGAFNEGQIASSNSGIDVQLQADGTDQFEYKISRSATFVSGSYAGKPVFSSNDITLLLESDGNAGTNEFAGGIAYSFATDTPEPATLGLAGLAAVQLVRRRRLVG